MTSPDMMLSPKVVDDFEFGQVVQIVDDAGVYAGYEVVDPQIQRAFREETGKDWLHHPKEYDELYMATMMFQRAVFKASLDAVGKRTLSTRAGSKSLLSDERDIVRNNLQKGMSPEPNWTERIEGGVDYMVSGSGLSDMETVK